LHDSFHRAGEYANPAGLSSLERAGAWYIPGKMVLQHNQLSRTMGDSMDAIYARISREFKNSEQISIAQQVDDGHRLSKSKVPPDRIYIDTDLSGKLPPSQFSDGAKKVRPALSRLLDDVAAGKVTRIITRKRDRLFRSTMLALRFYEYLKKHNCRLVCTSENLPESNDASGTFTLTILAAAAEMELTKTSENTKATKDWCKREGRKLGPCQTPGYRDAGRGKVEVDDKAAEMVRGAFMRIAAGESVNEVTRWMNDFHRDKCRPHGTKDAIWHVSSAWKMLQNRRYIGLNPDGTLSKLHEAIISPDLFWQVQEVIKARRGTVFSPQRQKRERPLSGLILCAYCLKAMRTVGMSKTNPSVRLYDCGQSGIRHDGQPFMMTEARWIEFLSEFFVNGMHPVQESDEAALLKSRIAATEDRGRELARLFAVGEVLPRDYATATSALAERRKTLKKQLANLTPSTEKDDALLEAFADHSFRGKPPHEQRVIFRRCIEKVLVYETHAIVHPVGDEPVTAPLMKEFVNARRAQNCLCPTQPEPFTEVKVLDRKRRWFNWKPLIDDKFFPHDQAADHLVSRKARRQHGLKGGKDYRR
jgi:DNA invertase Pin-like site-specific DNA recombinase